MKRETRELTVVESGIGDSTSIAATSTLIILKLTKMRREVPRVRFADAGAGMVL